MEIANRRATLAMSDVETEKALATKATHLDDVSLLQ